MQAFHKIAERRIIEAMQNGEFDNLQGKGKPFAFDDDVFIPEDLRMVYRFLKNSGCIPPEVEMRKEIVNLCSLMNTIDDDQERLKKIRELNFKLLQLNMTRKRPLNLEDFADYEGKFLDRFLGRQD